MTICLKVDRIFHFRECTVTVQMRSAEIPDTWDDLFEQCRGYIQLQDVRRQSVFSALQEAAKQAQCNLKLKIEVKNWTTRQGGLSGMDLETFGLFFMHF